MIIIQYVKYVTVWQYVKFTYLGLLKSINAADNVFITIKGESFRIENSRSRRLDRNLAQIIWVCA